MADILLIDRSNGILIVATASRRDPSLSQVSLIFAEHENKNACFFVELKVIFHCRKLPVRRNNKKKTGGEVGAGNRNKKRMEKKRERGAEEGEQKGNGRENIKYDSGW